MELELTVIPAGTHPGLEAYAAVRSAVVPREPVTAEEIGRSRLRRPGDVRMLARVDWHVAGCAGAIPSDLPGRTYARRSRCSPSSRRRGIGTAFLERIAAIARRAWLREHRVARSRSRRGRGGFAERFGLAEVTSGRSRCATLGAERVAAAAAGIEIVPVGARPDLLEGAYAARLRGAARDAAARAVRSFARSPSGPMRSAIGRSLPKRRSSPSRRRASSASPGCCGVPPTRGSPSTASPPSPRAIAAAASRLALKRRQIAWAARHGYRELVTWTQEGNDAMQAVNRKLGYVARPAWIRLEAPLETVAARSGGARETASRRSRVPR